MIIVPMQSYLCSYGLTKMAWGIIWSVCIDVFSYLKDWNIHKHLFTLAENSKFYQFIQFLKVVTSPIFNEICPLSANVYFLYFCACSKQHILSLRREVTLLRPEVTLLRREVTKFCWTVFSLMLPGFV